MKRLGLIVRSDFGGGLANQSREMHAHLAPDATLVMLMGDRGRGTEEKFQHYDPAYLVHYRQNDAQSFATMDAFLSEIDVMLSIETFYEPYLVNQAAAAGRYLERVLYANPELLNPADPAEHADRYLWPAEWTQPYPMPGQVLPWPCSTDITPRSEINWPPRFVHVGAPAMLDRNGTQVVEEAFMQLHEPVEITMFGKSGEPYGYGDTIIDYAPPVEDHYDLYRNADVLVLPRRYGSLSLTMLEAAAMGVPTLTTDLLPQSGWFKKWAPWLLIPAGSATLHSMKGSQIHLGKTGVAVHDPSSAHLALAMDRLAARADVLDALRVEVREWAEQRSWDILLPRWNETLRGSD